MTTFTLQQLKTIADTADRAVNFTREQIEQLRGAALYVCANRDYFVIERDGMFIALICAELLDADGETELNLVYEHATLDGAVTCALAWYSSDAGAKESCDAAAREIADYATAWQ